METKFNICDRVVFLNTATGKFEEAEVRSIRVLATGISKDEGGRNVLDGSMVLYETVDGPTVAECEVFGSADEARAYWIEKLNAQ